MLSAVHHTVTLWKGVCSLETDRHSYKDNSYQFLILEAAFLNGNVGNQQSIASNWFTNSYGRRLGYGGLWLWLYHMEVEVSCCQLYSIYIYILPIIIIYILVELIQSIQHFVAKYPFLWVIELLLGLPYSFAHSCARHLRMLVCCMSTWIHIQSDQTASTYSTTESIIPVGKQMVQQILLLFSFSKVG